MIGLLTCPLRLAEAPFDFLPQAPPVLRGDPVRIGHEHLLDGFRRMVQLLKPPHDMMELGTALAEGRAFADQADKLRRQAIVRLQAFDSSGVVRAFSSLARLVWLREG